MANLCFFFVIQRYQLFFPSYSMVILIYNLRFQNHFSGCFLSICQNTLYMYLCFIRRCNGSRDKRSPSFKMKRIGYLQESMPVNTRTCIPTAIHTFILHTDSYQIFSSETYITGYIQFKCSISINMIGYMAIIHPDICIHINSIESDSNTFTFFSRIYVEVLSIPSRTTYSKTTCNFRCSIRCKRRIGSRNIFNTPIMRKIYLTPL